MHRCYQHDGRMSLRSQASGQIERMSCLSRSVAVVATVGAGVGHWTADLVSTVSTAKLSICTLLHSSLGYQMHNACDTDTQASSLMLYILACMPFCTSLSTKCGGSPNAICRTVAAQDHMSVAVVMPWLMICSGDLHVRGALSGCRVFSHSCQLSIYIRSQGMPY